MSYAVPQQPVNWQPIEDALQAWVANVSGVEAVWAKQNAVHPPMPYITLDKLTGFIKSSHNGVVRTQVLQPEIRLIRVLSDAQASYTVEILESEFTYVKQLGDDIADIRTGILALVQAAPPSGVTAATSGADGFTVTGAPGVGINTTVSAGMSFAVTQEAIKYKIQQQGTFVLELQARLVPSSGAEATYQNATAILDRVLGSLDSNKWSGYLGAAGITPFNTTGPDDISDLDRAVVWSRAVSTISIMCVSEVQEESTYIETAELVNEIL